MSSLDGKLVVAISSRALFDFEQENQVYEQQSDVAYMKYQLDRIDQPANPGVAYPLIKKLLSFNQDGTERVVVVILSRNDPVSGLRIFRAAEAMNLNIQRGVFTRGRAAHRYLNPLGANLFLSADSVDVKGALESGFPAAQVFANSIVDANRHPQELRIAFDGDAVLFSDEAERIYKSQGLQDFQQHEQEKALAPLPPGPFMPLLAALHDLQSASQDLIPVKIRTALVTARSAPAHERAIRTLMSWNINVDEAMFLGGLPKDGFLREFEPDFFFDDQLMHCELASLACPTGHVPHGIANA